MTGSLHGPPTINIWRSDPSETEAGSTSCRRKVGRSGELRISATGRNGLRMVRRFYFSDRFEARARDLPNFTSLIWTVAPPRQVLSQLLGTFQSFQAGWYPGGQRVSVYGTRTGEATPSLWTVSLDGRDATRSEIEPTVAQHLKEAAVTFSRFVWSPRGDALFFEGTSADVKNVWRVTVDPKTLRWSAGPDRLTTGAELNDNISVSSDGSRIAFSMRTEKARLWSIPFDAVAGRITGPGEPFSDEGADAPYDVSSDGTRLIYRAIRHGKQELWMRSLAGGEDRLLLTAGAISAPRWSPDGRHSGVSARRAGAASRAAG